MKRVLFNIIDYFIPEELLDNSSYQDLWMYRCFCGIVIFILVLIIVSYFFHLTGFANTKFNFGLTIFLFLLSILSFKQSGALRIAVNLMCLSGFIILVIDTIDNGLILSEGIPFFVLIALISFIFSGVRPGVFWILAICSFLFLIYLETINMTSLFENSTPYNAPSFSLVIYIEFILMTLGLLFILDRSKWMVISQLSENERKLESKTEELEEKNTELERLKLELIKQNDHLNKYAAITAHDLKQPLRTISSFVTLLRAELTKNELQEVTDSLNSIVEGSNLMKEQVDKVLEINKPNDNS